MLPEETKDKISTKSKSSSFTFAKLPRVNLSPTVSSTESKEMIHSSSSEFSSEALKKEHKEDKQMKINPLLWQLHQQNNKKGGLVQTGQLLDRHRFMMNEDSSDSIPKVMKLSIITAHQNCLAVSGKYNLGGRRVLDASDDRLPRKRLGDLC